MNEASRKLTLDAARQGQELAAQEVGEMNEVSGSNGPSFDVEMIRKVAHLARLEVTDDELRRYAAQLSKVLEHMQQLNELDTTDVAPTAHALPVQNVLRHDEPAECLPTSDALHNAPKHSHDHFQVPKVLDHGGP